MLVFPNIKINLGLNVIAKRPDGFHALESVFYPVPWCDALEAVVSDKQEFKFTSTGLPIPGNESSNLIIKAYALLKEHYPVPPLEIHLHKLIPMGAGLGGGSSDAAFLLKLVNELCALGLKVEELEAYAGTLGSDCPFFIRNCPAMVTGRGEILRPISFSLKGYHIAIVMPPVSVGTAEAYSWITPQRPVQPISSIIQDPVNTWRNRLVNDFEAPVCARYPVIAAVRDSLYELGAEYAAMSGSGAAVYGLFRTAPDLTRFDAFTNFSTAL